MLMDNDYLHWPSKTPDLSTVMSIGSRLQAVKRFLFSIKAILVVILVLYILIFIIYETSKMGFVYKNGYNSIIL